MINRIHRYSTLFVLLNLQYYDEPNKKKHIKIIISDLYVPEAFRLIAHNVESLKTEYLKVKASSIVNLKVFMQQ